MTRREMDALLNGRDSIAVVLKNLDDGREVTVEFDRRALEYPHVWRATMRRALGAETGYVPPELQQEEHDEFVRGLAMLAERDERRRRPPPPPRRRRRKRKGGRR